MNKIKQWLNKLKTHNNLECKKLGKKYPREYCTRCLEDEVSNLLTQSTN